MQETVPYQTIVFMGKTGSGKGMQAHMLAEHLGYAVYSIGDKTREIAATDTPLGAHIKRTHEAGWIPEWLASYLMTDAIINECAKTGLVFESVARKLPEAEKLHAIHEDVERQYVVVHLEISDAVVTERQLARRRDGYDTPENIQNRLRAHKEETSRSIEFFRSKNKVVDIDADQSPEAVFTSILKAIQK